MTDIKRKFVSSSFWIVIGRGSSNLSSFVIFALLARFLGPIEFGLVAFASLFIDVTRALALAGTPQALVQRKEWDDGVASTAFWSNIAFAVVFVFIISLVVAPLVAMFREPRIGPILAALSLTFLVDAARATHEAKLQREFRYKMLASRTVISTIAGGVVGVTMAILHFGAWALVVSRITTSLIQTVMIWEAVRWVPKFAFSLEGERSLLAFGLHNSGAAFLGQLNARAPEFVIGAFLGSTAVGVYRVGTRAIGMLQDVVIAPMQATALSAFSRLENREAVGRAYLRLTKVCAIVSFPVYFGAAAIAPDFITLCFGATWADSGMVMAMLGLAGGAATLAYFSQPTLNALGRSDLAMVTSLVTLVTNFAVALISVRFGIIWVAFFVTARIYLSTPFGLYLVRTTTGISGREFLEGLAPQFISASFMLVVEIGMKYTLLQNLHPLLRMTVMVLSGAILYGASMLVIGRKLLKDVHAELQPIFSRFGVKP